VAQRSVPVDAGRQCRDRQSVCIDAVKATEQLLQAFPRFDAERRSAGKHTPDFGVALHLGECLYGNIGTKERLDFTVVGSAVNEASHRSCSPSRNPRHIAAISKAA